jgi:hypothetical protein
MRNLRESKEIRAASQPANPTNSLRRHDQPAYQPTNPPANNLPNQSHTQTTETTFQPTNQATKQPTKLQLSYQPKNQPGNSPLPTCQPSFNQKPHISNKKQMLEIRRDYTFEMNNQLSAKHVRALVGRT